MIKLYPYHRALPTNAESVEFRNFQAMVEYLNKNPAKSDQDSYMSEDESILIVPDSSYASGPWCIAFLTPNSNVIPGVTLLSSMEDGETVFSNRSPVHYLRHVHPSDRIITTEFVLRK